MRENFGKFTTNHVNLVNLSISVLRDGLSDIQTTGACPCAMILVAKKMYNYVQAIANITIHVNAIMHELNALSYVSIASA